MLEKNKHLETLRDELESLRRQEREKDSGSKVGWCDRMVG